MDIVLAVHGDQRISIPQTSIVEGWAYEEDAETTLLWFRPHLEEGEMVAANILASFVESSDIRMGSGDSEPEEVVVSETRLGLPAGVLQERVTMGLLGQVVLVSLTSWMRVEGLSEGFARVVATLPGRALSAIGEDVARMVGSMEVE